MKSLLILAVLGLAGIMLGGCESSWGSAALGAGGGAVAAGGGYEYHFKAEKDAVEKAYQEGRIDRREYEIRLDQIKRDSLLQK